MPLQTDSAVIESPFTTRRRRYLRYPWLQRNDRVSRIPNLNHGFIDPRQLPLPDTLRREWVVFDGFFQIGVADDEYETGPLCRRGSDLRYVLVKISNEGDRVPTGGWRLYFTRTEPASIDDLHDYDEVYPLQRDGDGNPVPSIRWSMTYLSRVSPDDRSRNFAGYYSFRFTGAGIAYNNVDFRVIIRQPVPEL